MFPFFTIFFTSFDLSFAFFFPFCSSSSLAVSLLGLLCSIRLPVFETRTLKSLQFTTFFLRRNRWLPELTFWIFWNRLRQMSHWYFFAHEWSSRFSCSKYWVWQPPHLKLWVQLCTAIVSHCFHQIFLLIRAMIPTSVIEMVWAILTLHRLITFFWDSSIHFRFRIILIVPLVVCIVWRVWWHFFFYRYSIKTLFYTEIDVVLWKMY